MKLIFFLFCFFTIIEAMKIRNINLAFEAIKTPEGDGGQSGQGEFVTLTHSCSLTGNGFPDHPHRGFETVTYMLEGSCLHKDSGGHSSEIFAGGIQHVCAGRGIHFFQATGVIHSEFPGWSKEKGERWADGFQLWINLPKKLKMSPPLYYERQKKDMVYWTSKGKSLKVNVIAGKIGDVEKKHTTKNPMFYYHMYVNPSIKVDIDGKEQKASEDEDGDTYSYPVDSDWNVFAYVVDGEASFVNEKNEVITLKKDETAFFNGVNVPDNKVTKTQIKVKINGKGLKEGNFILVGGKPIREPVVQHGPFVMNTAAEIYQTIDDYRQRRNGFEKGIPK